VNISKLELCNVELSHIIIIATLRPNMVTLIQQYSNHGKYKQCDSSS